MEKIKMGTIIKIGNHYLARGDSRDPELVKKLMNEEKINLVLCDPPYSISLTTSGFSGNKNAFKPIENDHEQSDEEYRRFTSDWINVLKLHLAKKNSMYIFNCDKKIFALHDGMIDCGCHFAQLLVWAKTHSIIGRLDYLPQNELIAYGWFGSHKFMRSKDKSILVYPGTRKNTLHPTMKPVGLLRRMILNSSKIDENIFDPFGGSGSTLIAAEQTRRRCYMIELDEDYCKTIISRFEKLTGIKSDILN